MNKDNVFKLQYFLVFLAFGSTTFTNLYYRSIGFSGTQIGFIGSIGNTVGLLALPLWGLISDYFNNRKKILMIMMSLSLLSMLSFTLSRSFYYITTVTLIISLFPFASIMDGNVLIYLGERSSIYGKFRVWGSIGFAVTTLISGKFIEKTSYINMFYLYAFYMAITIMITATMPNTKVEVKKKEKDKEFKAHLIALIKNKAFILFLLVVFLTQIGLMVGDFYFAIYMKSIKASESLIGVAYTVTGLSEIPVFIYSSHLIKKYGTKKLMIFSLMILTIRVFSYSIVKNPHIILGVQLLSGLDFAPFFAAAVNYVNDLAPLRLKSTAQSIFGIVGTNLSTILGTMISGKMFDIIGLQMVYRYASLLVVSALFILILFIKEKKHIV